MRIFLNCEEMVKEVERDLWEMGIDVHPQTMQDKYVAEDEDYKTKEVRGYGFQVVPPQSGSVEMLKYMFPTNYNTVLSYVDQEHADRTGGEILNPGNSHKFRPDVWSEFLHDGKFAYTYSERMTPQLLRIMEELKQRPDTRQAVINIHSNLSHDKKNIGGSGRIPCSMYYQFMRREGKLDLIYTMRSCDFLTHFPIDIALATQLQHHVAMALSIPQGMFTYFTGSLHAYHKDMEERGIF